MFQIFNSYMLEKKMFQVIFFCYENLLRKKNMFKTKTVCFIKSFAIFVVRLPNGVAVNVKSWSMNCPQATTMTVPACSWRPSSGWIVRDTTLAGGNGSPEAETLGADNLSENRGANNLQRRHWYVKHERILKMNNVKMISTMWKKTFFRFYSVWFMSFIGLIYLIV